MNLLKYFLFIATMLASNSLATDADDYAPDTLPLSEGSRRAFLLSTSVHASVNYVGDGLVRTPSAPGEQSESVAFPSTDLVSRLELRLLNCSHASHSER